MKEKLSLIWTLLIDRFKVTTLLVLGILIYGTIAYIDIPREVSPTIEIPVANILTVWPGATPGDVEKLITNKIEKEIKTLDNVDTYTSASLSGLSIVTVEFELDSDQSENIQRLREKIDDAKNSLPDTILDDPEINEVSLSDVPIVSLTLSGDFSWSELKTFAETIEDELSSIPKVKDVNVAGAPEDEVHIIVDPIKLQAQNLSISEVLQAIRAAHRDMPLGQINSKGEKIEVTLKAELETASEFMEIPIKTINGALITLGDFSEIRREFDTFEVETFFAKDDELLPAVLIDVTKSAAKGNVILMVEEVLQRIDKLKEQENIPYSLNINVTFNRSNEIQDSLNVLTTNGKQTLILIAIIMLLALGWRESLLASLAIPLAMLMGIIVLNALGRTFNGISLFALVLSIGLLVDNAIIIVEGLSNGIHEKKLSPHDSALLTLKTFRWPIITGTLTTIFAFLPMLFYITGVSGQYISVIPITVISVLLGALFMALFLLPSLGARFYQRFPPKKHRESKILKRTQNWYGHFMKKLLSSKIRTIFVLFLTFVIFVFSVGLLVTKTVPTEVFPGKESIVFAAKVELPQGSKLEETRKFISPLEEVLQEYLHPQPNGDIWLKSFIFTVGKGSGAIRDHSQSMILSEENILGVTINMTPKDSREITSYEIIPILRKKMEAVIPSYVEFSVSEEKGGPPTGLPLEIRLSGTDLEHLEQMTESLRDTIESMPETVNVVDSRAERVIQITWKFKRDVLSRFGLTPVSLLEPLRASVNGITVVKLTEGDDEIDVDLKIDWSGNKKWEDPQTLDVLDRIPLKTMNGSFITFRQLAEPFLSSELSQIDHRNGIRTMKIQGDVRDGIVVSQLTDHIKEEIEKLNTFPGEIIEFGGDAEEGNRIMGEMSRAMLAAGLLIFLVLVFQFNSYMQPFVILALVPLSLTSVFIGFWIMGLPIGFPTMIGIVALAGIIVNDAIVLMDQINHQQTEKGLNYIDSYIQAGKDRMQPIFLTSITTMVGLLPLSLSDKVWAGLGFAIIFGMALSTVLTLLLVPCFLITIRNIQHCLVHGYSKVLRKK